MKLFSLNLILLFSISLFGQKEENLISFEDKTNSFLTNHVSNGYVDYGKVYDSKSELEELVSLIEKMEWTKLSDFGKQSFLINAYNILVIDQTMKHYPVNSVKDISGFFDRTKFLVGGQEMTLNNIEKDYLLKEYEDSRFHFVLVCGAKDCPKLWNQAFRSEDLDNQLNVQTKKALNDSDFLKLNGDRYGLSEIFKWNRFEFGGKSDILAFINEFRDEPIEGDAKTEYYTYDWTLNDVRFSSLSSNGSANNSFRYVTSAAIPKGGVEIKIFNNLYSQKDGDGQNLTNRSTYFTSSLSFLYGKTNRFNLGFVTRYRRVLNSQLPSSALDVFQSGSDSDSRQGITAFGPQIRWAPIKSWSNFSIQSSLTIPIGDDLSGSGGGPFLDWAGPVFITQFFNDKALGDKFSLFTEVDIIVEEIGGSGKSNRVSTPVTGIFSWFPKKNLTVYALLGYSPFIVSPYDYFAQGGLGVKYQISPQFEVELLATEFTNKYLRSVNGNAATYNIGFRYSR